MVRRRPVELDDVQGNILRAYHLPMAAHTFVRIDDPIAARRWLGELVPRVTTAAPWDRKPAVAMNVAFTYAGLQALELPAALLASFPPAFRAGMAGRAAVLGDDGPSGVPSWEPGLGTGDAHLLVSQYASSTPELDDATDAVRSRLEPDPGLTTVSEQRGAELPGMREHFGFADGFGQPAIAGIRDDPADEASRTRRGRRRPLAVGEFLLGYPDSDGCLPPAPGEPLSRNGTYLVFRKLAQDVAGFRALSAALAAQSGGTEEQAAARLVGRWPDGTPLARSPDRPDPSIAGDPAQINNFEYGDDPLGQHCPLGAHIRRVNPRDALGFGYTMTTRHRIIRRGMPYGPPLPPGHADDGVDRGLLFLCFNVDLERQFEFIQSMWCNDGNPFGLGVDRDPLVGGGGTKFTLQGTPPRFLDRLPRVVVTRGGEYLFVPGIGSLRALAASPG
jgi:Dyp-type peroxidase family